VVGRGRPGYVTVRWVKPRPAAPLLPPLKAKPRSQMTMGERELVGIVWHRNAPHVIQRIYASGPLERVPGNRAQAEQMADNEDFDLVPTPVHLTKWVKKVP
jgi:hypothetical protein